MSKVNQQSCPYCFIDIDIDNHRSKLNLAASFVDATDSRYGFSSKDIRKLGGSELSRINDLIVTDHEWNEKYATNGIQVRPPSYGNRIIIKLYWNACPITCENFATLCTNGNNTLHQGGASTQGGNNNNHKKIKPAPIGQCGKPLSYKDSIIHRIKYNFIMQGGDFVFGNGSGGESIYNGKKFKDEKDGLQKFKHNKRGIVSMGNSGKNSNTSQFFITFGNERELKSCDGKHVIFGEVISGFEILDAVENVAEISSKDGNDDEIPNVPIRITDCGAFHPLVTPGAGYWFDQPDIDIQSFLGYTPVFMTRPRVAIVSPSNAAYDKFTKCIGSHTSCISFSLDGMSTHTGTGTGTKICKENILDLVKEKLESFAVDIVLVAPVYSDLFKSFELPTSWKEIVSSVSRCSPNISIDEVVLITKPVDAFIVIKEKSWIANVDSWHLDGTTF